MDTDTELVWGLFRHVFPEFTKNHVLVYKLLWRIEPLNGEAVIEKSGLARATVYRLLRELTELGLVEKACSKPVTYFAQEPVKAYSLYTDKIIKKLKNGKKQVKKLIQNSTSLSNEYYLVKHDGGQNRLIHKNTRQTILNEFELKAIRETIDQQLEQQSEIKLKAMAKYR